MSDKQDTPELIAYRVKALEKTVNDGFTRIEARMDLLHTDFVHKKDFESVKEEVNLLKKWKDSIVTRIATSAILFLVLIVLSVYGLDKYLR